jgi:autotransporter adhesin
MIGNTSSFLLNSNGATLSNTSTGSPIQLHGVADGTSGYDAVNLNQLNGVANKAYAGVASAIAMANIPAPAPGKTYAIGAAYGNYADEDAVAVGVKAVVGKSKNITLSADYAYANENSSFGAGVSYSF